MIDDQKSTRVVESWEGHKIILHCVVKKVLHDAPVRFYWLQQNRTLPGPQTSWKTLGQVSLVTVNDQDFEPVTCVAETEATTQRMEINIKRLCKYRFSTVSALKEVGHLQRCWTCSEFSRVQLLDHSCKELGLPPANCNSKSYYVLLNYLF